MKYGKLVLGAAALLVFVIVGIIKFGLFKNTSSLSNEITTLTTRSGLNDYYNPLLGIKFKYPNKWVSKTNYTKDSPIQAMIVSNNDADFRVILPLEINETYDAMVIRLKKQLSFAPGHIGFSDEDDITINGQRYHKVVQTSKTNNQEIKSILLWGQKNAKEYTFGFNVKSELYEQFLPDVQQIINSLELQ